MMNNVSVGNYNCQSKGIVMLHRSLRQVCLAELISASLQLYYIVIKKTHSVGKIITFVFSYSSFFTTITITSTSYIQSLMWKKNKDHKMLNFYARRRSGWLLQHTSSISKNQQKRNYIRSKNDRMTFSDHLNIDKTWIFIESSQFVIS